jgi:hypothetical protein
MRVGPQEERPGDRLLQPVLTDRLRHGDDVVFVEAGVEGGAPVPRRAKGDTLGGNRRIGPQRVEGRHQPRHVHQHGRLGGFPRPWINAHGCFLLTGRSSMDRC